MQTFAGDAQMLGPTFFVARSSFGVVGVIDQFGQLRDALAYPDTHTQTPYRLRTAEGLQLC